jgi:hypothetical protein
LALCWNSVLARVLCITPFPKIFTPSVPKYSVLEGSNFVPKYKVL